MYTEQFDALEYFRSLAEKNKLAVENGFKGCLCSGIEGAQGMMAEYQKTANFVMVDDITAGATRETPDGFYEKNTYTVFIFARYKQFDMDDYNEKMRLCRRIFHKFVSRIIYDQDRGVWPRLIHGTVRADVPHRQRRARGRRIRCCRVDVAYFSHRGVLHTFALS